jgi:hypothetical protein
MTALRHGVVTQTQQASRSTDDEELDPLQRSGGLSFAEKSLLRYWVRLHMRSQLRRSRTQSRRQTARTALARRPQRRRRAPQPVQRFRADLLPTRGSRRHGVRLRPLRSRRRRNTTILMQVTRGCYGTAPFSYPKNQGNTSVDIDGLLVGGSSGYPFRDGTPGPVKNLNVIDGSSVYALVDVNCSVVTPFQAQVVLRGGNGQPVGTDTRRVCRRRKLTN